MTELTALQVIKTIKYGNVPRKLMKRKEKKNSKNQHSQTWGDLGGGCRGCAPLPEMTYSFLIQLVFCKKNMVYWC